MSKEAELTAKFWKALKSDRTFMLGLVGVQEAHARPMTAMTTEDDRGPIWIFTSSETEIARNLNAPAKAAGYFTAKDHELFATIHGTLTMDNDPAMIDRLWNPYVAAWYKGGKTDPVLRLLRFDPAYAEVWLNEHSLIAGIRLLLGQDPKEQFRDKVATVPLSS